MSKFTIHIGKQKFSSKTEALKHYKKILNSHEPSEILNQENFHSVRQLVYKDYDNDLINEYEKETGDYLKSIKVDYHPEFKKTKCFFLLNDKNEEEIFSYIYAINGVPNDYVRFTKTCRFLVEPRLRKFKASVFKNRPVKCVITNQVVEWEECQIDHKLPLTFSVIIKSFIVSNNIDLSDIEYISKITKEEFKDKDLANKFDLFHKKMAVLRIISTKENNKLAGKSRIKPSKKDGVLT